jgi:hypothetical protein
MGDLYGLAFALRSDRTDVASYAAVLSDALGSALPEGMVEVERDRSMKDRLAGRPGTAVALRVNGADRELELRQTSRGVAAQIRHIVRGVVISRQEATLDEWVQALAAELAGVAQRDAAAADALRRLMAP